MTANDDIQSSLFDEDLKRPGPAEDLKLSAAASRLINMWNSLRPAEVPRVISLGRSRLRALRARLNENPDWLKMAEDAIRRMKDCPFLLGDNERGWRANIDFILRPGRVERILEGTYDQKRTPNRRPDGWGSSLAGRMAAMEADDEITG